MQRNPNLTTTFIILNLRCGRKCFKGLGKELNLMREEWRTRAQGDGFSFPHETCFLLHSFSVPLTRSSSHLLWSYKYIHPRTRNYYDNKNIYCGHWWEMSARGTKILPFLFFCIYFLLLEASVLSMETEIWRIIRWARRAGLSIKSVQCGVINNMPAFVTPITVVLQSRPRQKIFLIFDVFVVW